MILSNRVSLMYGADYKGPAIVYDGFVEDLVGTYKSALWTLAPLTKKHIRTWRLPIGHKLSRVDKKSPIGHYDYLCKGLSLIETNTTHPCLESFTNEATRIYPELDDHFKDKFYKFIKFLWIKYQLSEKRESAIEFANYSDDIGPFLLVNIGENFLFCHRFLTFIRHLKIGHALFGTSIIT